MSDTAGGTSESLRKEELAADKVAREIRRIIAGDSAMVKGAVIVNFEVHFIDGGIRQLLMNQQRKVL